jgi:hypothetical protein
VILQKIRYYGDRLGTVICAVDTSSRGAEFTVCGNNCIDAGASEDDEWDIIGDSFNGKLKEVTCPNCLKHIKFIKSLE